MIHSKKDERSEGPLPVQLPNALFRPGLTHCPNCPTGHIIPWPLRPKLQARGAGLPWARCYPDRTADSLGPPASGKNADRQPLWAHPAARGPQGPQLPSGMGEEQLHCGSGWGEAHPLPFLLPRSSLETIMRRPFSVGLGCDYSRKASF